MGLNLHLLEMAKARIKQADVPPTPMSSPSTQPIPPMPASAPPPPTDAATVPSSPPVNFGSLTAQPPPQVAQPPRAQQPVTTSQGGNVPPGAGTSIDAQRAVGLNKPRSK